VLQRHFLLALSKKLVRRHNTAGIARSAALLVGSTPSTVITTSLVPIAAIADRFALFLPTAFSPVE